MNARDKLDAMVTREPKRLIVHISEEDQAKAGGIAKLQCEFATGPSTSGIAVADLPTDTVPVRSGSGHHSLLSQLETDLERAKQLLEATKKRLHDLQMKRQEFGSTALTARELAELREKQMEVPKMRETVFHLERQVMEGKKLSSGDIHPALK